MSVRTAGVLDRSSQLGPHDHVAWCGAGAGEFIRMAGQAFAAAAARERLVLVGDLDRLSADAGELFADQLDSGRLQMVDVAAAYRPVVEGGAGFAARQLDTFCSELETALAAGYSGLRVAADSTSLLTGGDELEERWLIWEQLTDRWQVQMPVTGVCYFDRSRVPAERLDRVVGVHPLCSGIPAPSLRVYHDTEPGGQTVLMLDGAVEAFDEDELRERLRTAVAQAGDDAGGTAVTVDLSRVVYLHHRALQALGDAPVQVRHAPAIVRRLNEVLPEADRLQLD
jgi:MEDS: MEthanogen/methylotroph, DcmR Sensory domain